jgi:hypothetical protein
MLAHKVFASDEPNVLLVVLTDTKKSMVVNCSIEQYRRALDEYQKNVLIQDAFHFLSNEEREFLMTGMNQHEWNETFGDWNSNEDWNEFSDA